MMRNEPAPPETEDTSTNSNSAPIIATTLKPSEPIRIARSTPNPSIKSSAHFFKTPEEEAKHNAAKPKRAAETKLGDPDKDLEGIEEAAKKNSEDETQYKTDSDLDEGSDNDSDDGCMFKMDM